MRNTQFKVVAVILALLMTVALAGCFGCGGGNDGFNLDGTWTLENMGVSLTFDGNTYEMGMDGLDEWLAMLDGEELEEAMAGITGTFTLTENEITLVGNDGDTETSSFEVIDENTIEIDGDRLVRR